MPLEGYFDIIQAYFMHLTGRFVFFSGRDMALLEAWRDQGASAAAVCRGVRDAVRGLDKGDPPRNIWTCRDFIEPYVVRQRARRIPQARTKAPVTPSQGLAERAIRRVEQAGFACKDESIRALYRQAWYQIRQLAAADADRQVQALLDLELHLAQGYLQTLPDHVQRALRAQIASESGQLDARMDESARRMHLAARTRHHLVNQHGLVGLLD